MYSVRFSKSFIKDLKKLDKSDAILIVDKWIPMLQKNPDLGDRFVGANLTRFRKLAFRYKRVDYRIVYEIKHSSLQLIFLAVGSRENFYKNFRMRLG